MKRGEQAGGRGVSRETHAAIAVLCERYSLPPQAARQLELLLAGLEADEHAPTAIRGARDAVDVHLADSLAGLEVEALRAASVVADIGSGAGFPGLPLAAALPAAHFDLIEASRRKAAAIERLRSLAALANAEVVAARAEEWAKGQGAGRYDAVVVRAVASLAVLVEYAAPLLRAGGVLIAWKGSPDEVEVEAGAVAARIVGLEPAETTLIKPHDAANRRSLYVYSKVSDTPERFPRRPGMAAKRPLGA